MAFLFSLCLVLIVTLYGVCQAQCVIRTIVPMTMMDSFSPTGCCVEESNTASTSAEDLNAMLLLARALEMDRAKTNNNGVDVNGLLDNLIKALVYTATLNKGHSQNEWPGYIPEFTKNGNVPTGQAHSGKPVHGNNVPAGNFPAGANAGHAGPTAGPAKDGDDPLLGVNLLGSGDSNVAEVNVAGKTLLDLGLGDNDDKSGSPGLVGGLLDGLL